MARVNISFGHKHDRGGLVRGWRREVGSCGFERRWPRSVWFSRKKSCDFWAPVATKHVIFMLKIMTCDISNRLCGGSTQKIMTCDISNRLCGGSSSNNRYFFPIFHFIFLAYFLKTISLLIEHHCWFIRTGVAVGSTSSSDGVFWIGSDVEIWRNDLYVEKIATKDNPVDMLSKVVPKANFEHYLNLVGIRSCPSLLHVELWLRWVCYLLICSLKTERLKIGHLASINLMHLCMG